MDAPNMPTLHRLGTALAAREVRAGDFPSLFDLPAT